MSTHATTSTPTRLLRRRAVAERVGLSAVTIWRLQRTGQFPKSIQISPGAVAWRETDIERWIEEREAATSTR
jgi:prophage regulatory protein